MIKKLTASQIYNLMVEQPGSAEGRDVAVEAVGYLDQNDVKQLRDRITKASNPESPDYKDFENPINRGYLLGQLGKITGNDIHSINLLLKHLDPEIEPNHWVRFWTLTGVHAAKLNKTPQIAQWIVNRYVTVNPGNDYKSLLFANAVLAETRKEVTRDSIIEAPINAWLEAKTKEDQLVLMLPCQDALRVLSFVSRPKLVPKICQILANKAADPRMLFLACQALAAIPPTHAHEVHMASQALCRFLEGAGNTRILLGVREEALQALGRLKDPTTEFTLLKEIKGGNLNLIKAASRALGNSLGIEKAVQRIMALAAKDENPHTRNSFSIALRWMSDDREKVTDALDEHMNSGKIEEQEYARMLMAEMGGASAADRLSERSKVVNDYNETLLAEQSKFEIMFDETMLEARQGFTIALAMDVVVFVLGMVLLIASGAAAMFNEGSLDSWVGAGMGGVGVLGIVYGTLIANPRKKVFSSVNNLMNFKIIFLAYLRQLHQNDQSFTRTILEDQPISLRVLEEYFLIISDSLQEAVDNMIVLKAHELKEKIADYEDEVANRDLEVKQRIGDVNAGIGRPDSKSELEARINEVEAEKAELEQSLVEKKYAGDDINEGPRQPVRAGETAPGPKPTVAPGPKPTAQTAGAVPQAFIDHLVLREGWVEKVYLDSLGKPTAGLGHLLKSNELTIYKVGQTVPSDVLNRWAQADSKWAYEAGVSQSKEAGIESEAFQLVLGSVNFQLGPSWRKKFPGTWKLIANGDYLKGAEEAANSNWFKQTPVRTMDLQRELLNLAGHPSDYDSLNKLNAAQIQRRGVKVPSKRTYDAGAIHGSTAVVSKATTQSAPKTAAAPTTQTTGEVPKAFIDHLVLREGWVEKVYLDSLGKPTAGLGHLLKPEEQAKYKVGQTVPADVLNKWAQADSKWAYEAGVSQSKEAGIESEAFQLVLGSVNFQLGPSWRKKFPGTWKLIANGDYLKGAEEAANSNWFKQTPVRTMDLQRELLNLAGHPSDYDSLNKLNAAQIQRRGVKVPSKSTYDAGAIHGSVAIAPKPVKEKKPETTSTPKPKTSTVNSPAKATVSAGKVSVSSLPPISASVGKGGVNKAADVAIIQEGLLTMGYLQNTKEYDQVKAMAPDDKVTSLPDTITAIGYFQLSVQGSKKPDSNVGANGASFRSMKARVELIAKYKNKPLSQNRIPQVIPDGSWISQMGDDSRTPAFGRKITRAEIGSTPFNQACKKTCDIILKEAGVTGLNNLENRIECFFEIPPKGVEAITLPGSAELCAKFLEEELGKGKPVLVGVDRKRGTTYNHDNTTDHFVVIVGKEVKDGKIGFRFFDVGTARAEAGANPNAIFWLDQSDWSMKATETYNKTPYTLSQVRQNA